MRLLLRLAFPAALVLLASSPSHTPPPAPTHVHQVFLERDSSALNIPEFLWPTNASRNITSSFGEFRQTHFHLGMDVSTWDRIGYEVYAAADGYISRISISATGYGKMVQIRHPNGYTTLYGHLSGFTSRLATAARKEQRRLGRYPINLNFATPRYPVKKGDVVAYSGETGIGTPHLHFEIRNAAFDGLNPHRSRELQVSDSIPPDVKAIALIPLSEKSRINGSWEKRVFPVQASSPGSYGVADTIFVSGSFGVAVNARDRSDGTRFEHGVYRTTLLLDSKVLQSITFDEMPARGGQQILSVYDFGLRTSPRDRYLRLWVASPHRLPIYKVPEVGSGTIGGEDLASGSHLVQIENADFAGNTALVSFIVVHEKPGVPIRNGARNDASTGVMAVWWEQYEEFIKLLASVPRQPEGEVTALIQEGSAQRQLSMMQEDAGKYAVVFRPLPAFSGERTMMVRTIVNGKPLEGRAIAHISPILPGHSGKIELDGGNLVLQYKQGSTFKPLFLTSEKSLFGTTPVYSLNPETVPLDDGIEVGVKPSIKGKKLALFMRDGTSWSLLSRKRSSPSGFFWGHLGRRLGELAILSDDAGPTVSRVRISPSGSPKPLISFRFDDNPAGVEYNMVKTYIDGVLYIPEIEGEDHRATVQVVDPLTRGSHRLMIRLADKLGNVSVVEREFSVR